VPGDVGERDGVLPYVTVVMPLRNEARSIATSLATVLGQDYPAHRFEVIVADGMSDDGTREAIDAVVAAARGEAASVRGEAASVTIIDNPGLVVATGLNAAISMAKGDVIVRVDGHCEVQHDYVTTCVRLLEETGADNVGGITSARGTGLLQRAIALGMSSPFGVGNARFRYASKPGWVDTVFPGAWRREVFERIGGFDEELVRNQDDELNLRLRKAGGTIVLDPSIEVRYRPRGSLRKVWDQYYEYGLWKVPVMRKHGEVQTIRGEVPLAFVLSMLVLGAAAPWSRVARRLLAAQTLLYTGLGVVFAVRAVRGRGEPLTLVPVVFAAFPAFHLGHGWGHAVGLLRALRDR